MPIPISSTVLSDACVLFPQRQQADLMVTAAVEEMRNKLSSLLDEGGTYVCIYLLLKQFSLCMYICSCIHVLYWCMYAWAPLIPRKSQ